MDSTIQSVAALLERFVTRTPGQLILGAQLGGLLRAECPNFSPSQFQARNLRQFIRTYVPEIVERGRSGPDYYYGLPSAEGVFPSALESRSISVKPPQPTFDWKAFSNPSYPFVLAANRSSGEFQTRTQNAVVAEPWVTVPKPTTDDHLQIARDFVQTLADPSRTALTEILARPIWYTSFSAAARQYGVGSSWASFRISRLREFLDRALVSLGIPRLTERPSATSLPRAYANRLPTPPNPRLDPPKSSRETALRKLVQLVVAEMPISDLRELALPIGKVMDHIDEIL